ncbi:ATP-binding protein [Phenylobacterium sp.]|uniref:ATP-binding protein n=1 Tax=Phenylobacterium sp. TaxID=1871053 RepID=UPI002ED7E7C9
MLSIALAILTAWAFRSIGAPAPTWVYRMNPTTAAALILAGVSLLLARTTLPCAARHTKALLGVTIAAIGAVRLSELAIGAGLAIDLMFFPSEVLSFKLSRMAPTTAAAFTLLGAAIVASTLRGRAVRVSQALAAGALAVSTLGLISYAYGAFGLVEFTSASAMALQTAICLSAASVGILWTRPHRAITGLITNSTLGGAVARRVLPVIVLITVLLGGTRVAMARQEMLNEVTGIALLITAILTTLVVVFLMLADGLRRLSLRLAARERALVATAEDLRLARDAANMAARVKADFIANMSHEIRTPLTAIVGYADRLTRRTDLGEGVHREIVRVDKAAQALLSIVNDVLDFSKLEAGQVTLRLQPVDPSRLMADALHLFEQQAAIKGVSLEFSPQADLPKCLLLDEDRMRQILLNLVSNAVKFTDRGAIRLAAAYDPEASRLDVSVTDSGPGMDAEQMDMLFRRFSQVDASSTRRFGGTGLGLAISKGLVEAMGGEIGVRSSPGQGSTFHFEIPAAIGEWPLQAHAGGGEARLAGARVLLVDDDTTIRELARDVLVGLGATVTEAGDGLSGVALASAQPFDVILMDIRMPGLDGTTAAARIRDTNGPNWATPILAFSANVEPGADGAVGGFDGHIRKPFSSADLAAAVSACLPASSVAPA